MLGKEYKLNYLMKYGDYIIEIKLVIFQLLELIVMIEMQLLS
jgi:hypothetical protein